MLYNEEQETAEELKVAEFFEEEAQSASNTNQIAEKLDDLEKIAQKTRDEVYQIHKLYHNEYANRLRNVESELSRYQKLDSGRAFDEILGEIAKLYSDNIEAVNKITEEHVQKQLNYMFLDLLQLLENNGVYKQQSQEDDVRHAKYCQVVERIKTTDQHKHDTVAKSLNVGFYVENRPLIKERIHCYVYEQINEEETE